MRDKKRIWEFCSLEEYHSNNGECDICKKQLLTDEEKKARPLIDDEDDETLGRFIRMIENNFDQDEIEVCKSCWFEEGDK